MALRMLEIMKYFAWLIPIGTVQEINDLKSKFTVMYMYLYTNPPLPRMLIARGYMFHYNTSDSI